MEKELGTHQGRTIVERDVAGRPALFLGDDDVAIPFEERSGRVYSPLFPYRSFAGRVELAKEAIERGVKNLRRPKA